MDANDLLREMVMSDPCDVGWNNMRGDDRKRFCESCGKHVHNLTAMSSDEVVALLQEDNASVCGRVARGSDGTLYIPSEDAALSAGPRRWQFHLRSIMALIAAFAGILGLIRVVTPEADGSPLKSGSNLVSSPRVLMLDGMIDRRPSAPSPATAPPSPPSQP